jgi:uncharacterized protein (DUF2062 family)
MPRKLLKRFIPSPQFIKAHPSLSFLGFILADPNLYHLNRYSGSMAFLVGVFLAFFPIPGQMVVAAIIAFWVRCNLPIAVALVWITNPITIPPIFFATYKLGTWLLDTPAMDINITFTWEWINSELGRLWRPLFIGSLFAGSFFSLLSYISIKLAWRCSVTYQWLHRSEKRAQRLKKAQEKIHSDKL